MKVPLWKFIRYSYHFFLFLAVLYQFLQQLPFFMNFEKFIQHLPEKRFSSQIFLFLMDLPKLPTPLTLDFVDVVPYRGDLVELKKILFNLLSN